MQNGREENLGEVTWSQLGLVARQVRSGLWAQLWTHVLTAGAMAMALLVFGMFMLLQENLQSLLKGWGDQIQVNVYLAKALGATEVSLLRDTIQNYPEVERVRHISQEQAWKDFQAALGPQSNLLEGLPQDVLPASFEISVKAAYRDGPIIEAVAERLRKEKGVAAVEYPQEWVNRLSRIVLAVQGLQWIFGGMLFVATFFIVGSAVRLSILARKDEIEIMRWVGAPPELIQGPLRARRDDPRNLRGRRCQCLGSVVFVPVSAQSAHHSDGSVGQFGPAAIYRLRERCSHRRYWMVVGNVG